jgi:hypothetical protein
MFVMTIQVESSKFDGKSKIEHIFIENIDDKMLNEIYEKIRINILSFINVGISSRHIIIYISIELFGMSYMNEYQADEISKYLIEKYIIYATDDAHKRKINQSPINLTRS